MPELGNSLTRLSSIVVKYNNRVAARVKISSEKGQKHIYAQEHQLYYYYNKFKWQYTV